MGGVSLKIVNIRGIKGETLEGGTTKIKEDPRTLLLKEAIIGIEI
tara:strand:+ start:210 stop:344 length:135 start_codon:yes stop_codon:yes gene_type:complete